jgi:hypothetical protein
MGQLVFQATLGGQVNLIGPNTASTFNINVPATSGNMVTTGDTGTVTTTMLASTTGSGAVVLATSPTLVTPALGTPSALVGTNITGTAAGLSIGGNAATATTATNVSGGTSSVTSETVSGNLTLSGGTANGVAYLNGSKVVTTGSALTYNGTNLGLDAAGGTGPAYLEVSQRSRFGYDGANVFISDAGTGKDIVFTRITEQMRLTSTGLGIGTSSPQNKLVVSNSGAAGVEFVPSYSGLATSPAFYSYNRSGAAWMPFTYVATSHYFGIGSSSPSSTLGMLLDTSGNLGLGVTPSAWAAPFGSGVFEFLGGFIAGSSANNQVRYGLNSYYNGSNYIYKTTAAAGAYIQNAGQHQWFTAPSGTAGNTITFTQAMTLAASGRLLVGTTTEPSGGVAKLAIYSTSGGGFQLIGSSNTGGAAQSAIDGGGQVFYTYTGSTGSESYTERARIDSSGNLLVGQTSNGNSPRVGFYNASGIVLNTVTGTTSTATQIQFSNPNGNVGSVTTNGTATLYNVTSDQRLKENIVDAPAFGSVIDSMQVRSYDWKTDHTHQRAGFIAQELVTVAPEAVHQPADPEEMMAVDYSKLVPMLVKEIQDLRKRLAAAGI